MKDDDARTLTFDADVSLFRDRTVLLQLTAALGIPLILVLVLLIAISRPSDAREVADLARFTLAVAGIIVVLALFAIGVVYGGKYQYCYKLDERGVERAPRGRTARTNKIANTLLMLSGRPTAMGAGMMAASRQRETVAWSDVEEVEGDSGRHTVVLRGVRGDMAELPCPERRYEEVLRHARSAVERAKRADGG